MQARQTMQGKVCLFLIFLVTTTVPAEETPDLYKNQLHFGYGINYKYNGKLYHNLDRVWVVHRVVIPQIGDLNRLPDFPDTVNCIPHVKDKEMDVPHLERKVWAQTLCKAAAPHLKMLQKQASYLKRRVTKIVKDDLYHALHSLHPVSHFVYRRKQKRALTPTPGSLLVNETLINNYTLTSNIPIEIISRNRSERAIGLAAIASAALPALGKLATLAIEELGAYLQRKRNRALKVALQELDQKVGMSLNEMHQLEREFLLYGEYDVNSTMSIIKLLDSLDNRTSNLERILEMKIREWTDRFYDFSSGPAMYSHMFQLYIDNLREKYIRLYEALETELNLLLRSIAILSKGYLPPQLFPPTTLVKISQKAIAMIKTKNPDYVLALPHITDYYDMRLVTFGLDDQGKLVICFPIFIKEYKKEPMTLYQIETVKVPITDTNTEADSYTETAITKPYLASNKEYYIQLVLPELVMCKKIRGTFYCEELFLVKHKTKLSCESAIFYNLTRDVILENCKFNYYYNTTVLPSILDGGSHILLANMLNPKRLICSYDQGLAKPLPTSSYALVSRDILCYCHLQIGLTYILKSIASCNVTTTPTLEYTVNLAFMDYFQSFWKNGTLSHIPLVPSMEEIVLPVAMEDYTKDPQFLLYGKDIKRNPNTLAELSQIIHQKQAFLKSRKELFSKPKADIRLPETPLSKRSKSSFLFSAIFHIYIFVGSSVGIMWLIPCILFAMKQRKMKTLVSAMALHQAKPIEAVAASTSVPEQTEALITTSVPSLLEKLTGMDIPTNHMTKLVCHDPWVSFIVTVITIVGVVVYVYRSCRHMSFLKGHKFASICHVHIIFCNNTRYVPLKIGHYIGSPFLFQYNELPLVENITLHKHCLWDILHVEWDEERIHYKDRSIPLREHLSVPLKDKIRLRWILKKNYQVMYMVKQGDTWYNLTKL